MTDYPNRRPGPRMILLSRRAFAAGAASLTSGSARLVEPTLRLPPAQSPAVALTLDACPGGFDERLARVLADNAIEATIFVTSLWIDRNPAGLSFLLGRPDLFTLQNHGDRHRPPVLGTTLVYGLQPAGTMDAIRAEVAGGAAAIVARTGATPTWYRGAAALYSPEVLDPIRAMGFALAGFSLNADQGASLAAATVAARIAKARDGDVIIGHINQPHRPSGAGIAAGAVALKNQGMRFVRLPDRTAT